MSCYFDIFSFLREKCFAYFASQADKTANSVVNILGLVHAGGPGLVPSQEDDEVDQDQGK